MTWLVAAVVLVVALVLWLSWTANRLDRMHHRIDVARAVLDARLLHRSGTTMEVAGCDALDPATRLVLLDAAHGARQASPGDFEAAESALSETLRAAFDDAEQVRALREADREVGPLLRELADDARKVELARRRRVRWLHLAGHAAELRAVDLDDVPPSGLVALADGG